jgi:hypothetical protein
VIVECRDCSSDSAILVRNWFKATQMPHIKTASSFVSSHDSRVPRHQRGNKIAVENRDPIRTLRNEVKRA